MVASISKGDWENFRAVGRVPPSIREVVLQSWQRSSRMASAAVSCAPMLAEDEIRATRKHARHLRRAATLALSRADYLLQQTGNMLLLCDRDGIVLDAVGDSATLSRGRENHLGHGGRWSEAAIGTNAIGTAIHLGRPVQINGAEHYSEHIQRWSCAASPVKDPGTGNLLGVIDISWPQGMAQPGSTALSSALALQVESELARQLAQDRQALLEFLYGGRLSDRVLLLDRTGTQVFASEGFVKGLEDPQALARLRHRIPALMEGGREAMLEALADCLPGASLSVIEPNAEAVGVMVSLPVRSRHRVGQTDGQMGGLAQIAACGPTMAEIVAQARRLLQTGLPILIEGETGTGKTHLARAIHDDTSADGPFILLECAALCADSLRDDLAQGRLGLRGGTLCLDKPARASVEVQKLLLSVIEQAQQAGARVMTLAARSLFQSMQADGFRSDLYYRIAGARLVIPPLRDRRDDIPVFLREVQRRHQHDRGGRELRFTNAAMTVLRAHSWPGNLREMQNVISALSALSANGLIDERDLPPEMRQPDIPDQGEETLRDVEKTEILTAIAASGGNLTETARRLGIARSTLYLKLDAHGISRLRKS